jgi:hypothetical protein
LSDVFDAVSLDEVVVVDEAPFADEGVSVLLLFAESPDEDFRA